MCRRPSWRSSSRLRRSSTIAVAPITGRDRMTARRAAGDRRGLRVELPSWWCRARGRFSGQVSWWLLAAFSTPSSSPPTTGLPQRHWPRGGTTFTIGAAESFWSGVLALPFMLVLSPPWVVEFTGKMALLEHCGGDADVDGRAHRLLHPDPRARARSITCRRSISPTPVAVIFARDLLRRRHRHLAVAVAGDPDGGPVAQQFGLSRQTAVRLISASSRSRVTGTAYSASFSSFSRGR